MTDKLDETINRICDSLEINDPKVSLPLLFTNLAEWCDVTHKQESSDVVRSILINQLNGSLKKAIPHFKAILEREDNFLKLNENLVEQIDNVQKKITTIDVEIVAAQKKAEDIKKKEKELGEKQDRLKGLEKIQAIPEEELKDISEKIKTLITDYPILADLSNNTDLLFQHLNDVENTLIQVRRYQTEEKQKKILNLTKELTVIKTENLSRSEEIDRLSKEIEDLKQKTEKITAEKIALEKQYTESKENFTRHYEENLKVAEEILKGSLPKELSNDFSKIQEGLDGLDKRLASLLKTKNEQKQL